MIKTTPLRDLPEIHFADPDVSVVEEQLFSTYEQVTGRKLYPGNPERLFLDSVAVEISRLLYLIDWTGKQNLLAYSSGDFLEHLGALFGVTRLVAEPAYCTVRFEIDEALGFDVSIDEGTRVTHDQSLMFATAETVRIQAGELSASVRAICQTAGKIGNGLVPGQINLVVDQVDYVERVINETTSLGGCDAETDDQLRDRVHLAPEAFSCGGPEGAYVYHARSVSQRITDVTVHVPEPGRVVVTILEEGGLSPDADLVADVAAALNQEKTRPLTDTVVVQAPTVVFYDLEVTFWILAEYGSHEAAIRAKALAKIEEWKVWQREALGRSIRPSVLIDYVQSIQGIHHVEVDLPEYEALEPWEVAELNTETIAYGGLIDD